MVSFEECTTYGASSEAASNRGCGDASTRFAALRGQAELRALGAWSNPATGRRAAPSDSTICRVLMDTDPDALQAVLLQWPVPRLAGAGPTSPLFVTRSCRSAG